MQKFWMAPVAALWMGCSGATDETASAGPETTPATDLRDAGPTANGSDASSPVTDGTDDPTEWSFVYARYFAAGTAGHCGNSGCHGQVRAGFRCGDSKDTCFEGLVEAGLVDRAKPRLSKLGDPERTPLAWYGLGGPMPADAALANKEAADAVTLWLLAGANNGGAVRAGGGADAGLDGGGDGMDGGADDARLDVMAADGPDGLDSARSDAGADAHAPDAQVPDAQAPDAQAPDAQAPDAQAPDAGPHPTWTALYNSYFGPNTAGHCGNSGCHSSARAGFKCGPNKTTCYDGLVAKGLIDRTNPARSTLGDGSASPLAWFSGNMPADNAVANAAAARAVSAWLNAGASRN